jgi:hypothetical protein
MTKSTMMKVDNRLKSTHVMPAKTIRGRVDPSPL